MLIAITGGAGRIGTVLRAGLSGFDLLPLDNRPAGGVRLVELTDEAATVTALAGVDTVVHLAAFPDEGAFERILADNIVATRNVFEAARRQGVRRVVYASSIHVDGFYSADRPTSPADPVRPDTWYGVSKVYGEAAGRLYADKHGISVVCLRLGGFQAEPLGHPGFLSLWLSHRDAVRLFRAAVTAPDIDYLVAFGVSANSRGVWSRDGWAELGYEPVDDAEAWADRYTDGPAPRYLGLEYTERDFQGWSTP
jgi:uronate dehydrogenase